MPVRGKEGARKVLAELRKRKPACGLKDDLCIPAVTKCIKNLTQYAGRDSKGKEERQDLDEAQREGLHGTLQAKHDLLVVEVQKLRAEREAYETLVAAVGDAVDAYRETTAKASAACSFDDAIKDWKMQLQR